jgi:hypothetical protein
MVLDVGCFDQQKWAVQSFERSEEVSATSNLRKEWSLCLCIIHGRSTTAQGECGREQTQELEERMVFVAIILKRRRSNTPLITTGNRFGPGSGSSCFGASGLGPTGHRVLQHATAARVAAWPDFETIAVKLGPSGSCWIGSGERPAPVILRACLAVRVRVFRHPGTDPRTRQLLRCPRSRRVDDRRERDGSNLAPGPRRPGQEEEEGRLWARREVHVLVLYSRDGQQSSGPGGRGRACPQRKGKLVRSYENVRRAWGPFVLAEKFPIYFLSSLPYMPFSGFF